MALFPDEKRRREHGGEFVKGHRKERRPIALKKPMHLVFRSEKARGRDSFLIPKHARYIEKCLNLVRARFQVQVYQHANSGNHVHLIVKARSRRGMQGFLRWFPAQVAKYITGAKRGAAFGKFWSQLVYSRLIEWGKGLSGVRRYLTQNTLEALGLIPFTARKKARLSTGRVP